MNGKVRTPSNAIGTSVFSTNNAGVANRDMNTGSWVGANLGHGRLHETMQAKSKRDPLKSDLKAALKEAGFETVEDFKRSHGYTTTGQKFQELVRARPFGGSHKG